VTRALGEPIERYASVAAWRRGLEAQWGEDALAEDPRKLEALAEFCESFGKDPDQLVAFCFLRKRATGERFASSVRRKEVGAALRAHCDALGLGGTARRKRVADVLSFLIHNGVLMTTSMV
jgi:hypothetical protein